MTSSGCPAAAAVKKLIASPSTAEPLTYNEDGSVDAIKWLESNGIMLDKGCDKLEILTAIRDAYAALSDEQLAEIVGGEVKVTAAIIAAGAATVAVVGAGVGVVTSGALNSH
jgi:hypothetical protein